jgi:hypothetical protein
MFNRTVLLESGLREALGSSAAAAPQLRSTARND